MLAIIALVLIAIAVLAILGFAAHILFSPWLLLAALSRPKSGSSAYADVPVRMQVSRCTGLSVADRKFPPLPARRARRLRSAMTLVVTGLRPADVRPMLVAPVRMYGGTFAANCTQPEASRMVVLAAEMLGILGSYSPEGTVISCCGCIGCASDRT